MKIITYFSPLILLLSLARGHLLKAQHNELSLQTASGLFAFRGSLVASQSFFNIGTDFQGHDISYTNDIFSSKSGFSYGFSVQGQHITKGRFIYGLQLSYESLATRTQITQGYDSGILILFVQGHSTTRYQYLNLHPLLGYRWGRRAWQLDLTVGVDLASGLFSGERGQAFTASHLEYTTHRSRPVPPFDQRPRIDLTGYYRRFGISVGYAKGTANYSADFLDGYRYATYSQLWRAGLIYRLFR